LRVATAQALVAAHPECDLLLVDDGLQHYALERDFEIAVVDAHRGLGNARLLPAGPLREPAWRLDSVDAVVLNGTGTAAPASAAPAYAMTLAGDRFVAVSDAARSESAAYFAGQRVVAIAGIGNPVRFFEHLRALGLAFEAHAFPDHHPFALEELAFPHADAIVMTQKDGIKCRGFDDARMWELPVHAQVPDELIAAIAQRVRIRRTGAAPG
jgi:tetraacyldisaccharide 4'-kinase